MSVMSGVVQRAGMCTSVSHITPDQQMAVGKLEVEVRTKDARIGQLVDELRQLKRSGRATGDSDFDSSGLVARLTKIILAQQALCAKQHEAVTRMAELSKLREMVFKK